ncbi:MAG: HIT domain-containing protein [Bacillus subtilis]|nr:HIT domain-containing protein [Bacillus subtilis]
MLCLDALEKAFNPAGFNIGYNMGLAAGASIDHLHLHIIPRYPPGDRHRGTDRGQTRPGAGPAGDQGAPGNGVLREISGP